MSDYKIHMIGNAHIDPVWLWVWTEGRDEVLKTYRQAVEFMKEFPDFIFSAGQAATYKWVEEGDPKLFSEIKKYVKEGRWNIVNGWWIQPDCNIPSGESFARQSLYGKGYFMEKFGVDVRVGYNVDSFGHNRGLPQILKKSGMDFYVFMRPDPNEKQLESRLFWWESQDKTRVLAMRLPISYGTSGSREELKGKIDAILGQRLAVADDDMCFYGVGDHGGGPSREEIRAIKEYNRPGVSLAFSAPEAFFASVLGKKKNIPVVREDLQHHSRGCYSVVAWIKQANRVSESLLVNTEKFCSAAQMLDLGEYPGEKLKGLWHKVLFNQFHDIMGGTSIEEAYKDCRKDYDDVLGSGSEILGSAVRKISSGINTLGNGRTFVFFNPSAWNRKQAVVVEAEGKDLFITGPKGKKVMAQETQSGKNSKKVVFMADVPPLGYSAYNLSEGGAKRRKAVSGRSRAKASGWSLENDFYFLQMNPRTGGIMHIYDKANKVSVIASGKEGNEMLVLDDTSDTWSHSVKSYEKVTGKFIVRGEPEVIESGPLRASLRMKSVFLNSVIEQEITLCHSRPCIEFNAKINWLEKHKMLKVGFSLSVVSDKTVYEVPFGTIERSNNGDEEPGRSWIDMCGTAACGGRKAKYGVALINDCKYGFSMHGNEMRMSVLRSPIFAFHDPRAPEPGVEYHYTDQGEHSFRYMLACHKGSWQNAGIPKIAHEFNNPLIVSAEGAHSGSLPKQASFVKVTADNVIVEALKKEEAGEDVIIRMFESCGRAVTAGVSFPVMKFSFSARFRPYEIKTFRIDFSQKKVKPQECNLLEQSI